MARKKKTATKTTQAETLTNETIEVKATQVEETGMSLQAHDFFNHLSEEIDLAAESGNIEALENLNYYAHLLWLKADQAENKVKASKVKQLEPEPQPEPQPQPEPVKPAHTKYVCWNYQQESDTTYLYLANSHEEAKEIHKTNQHKEDLSPWGYGLYEKAPKIGKLITVEPESQPESKPEPVKPEPVDQSKVSKTKKQMAQKRLDEILRAFPEYRMFLPRPLHLAGALKFIEDYGHLVPEVEPIKLHPNQAPAKAGKAGKVKKADDAPEYVGKVEPSKSGVAYAYRDLQALLKEARNAGKSVNCRLNGKREVLQAEAVRLGLL